MKKLIALMVCLATLLSLVVLPARADAENPFTDIKKGSWYYASVLWCYAEGLMSGTSKTTFSPNTPVSRAMFVTVLAKIDGADTSGYNSTSFSDVPLGKWYTNAVEWAFKNDFASGVGGGKFNPNGNITREQLAVFLCNYCRKKDMDVSGGIAAGDKQMAKFKDASSVSKWALESVKWALGTGMISGASVNTVSPKTAATRAQLSVILKQFFEKVLEPSDPDRTLTVAIPYSGVFSPFYGSDAGDNEIVSLTQVYLISGDRRGEPVLRGIEGETRDYNGTEYTYYGPADITITEKDDGTVDYDIKLREDMVFSDGIAVTADDVIFTMYALADPTFNGVQAFDSLPIVGMEEYRAGIDSLYNLLIKAGRGNTDFSVFSKKVQTQFWSESDEAAIKLAKEIVTYCESAGYCNKGDVIGAAEAWGFEIYKNTVKAFADAIMDAYGGDIVTAINYENAGSAPADLFPNIDKYVYTAVKTGISAPNISGIVKTGDHSLTVTVKHVDPAVLPSLAIPITPLHYYGDPAKYDYSKNSFGFDKGDLSTVRRKTVPMGAGPFRVVSKHSTWTTLEMNDNYYLGSPKIAFVKVVNDGGENAVECIMNGEYDVSSSSYNMDTIKAIKKANGGKLSGDVIHTAETDNLGYGYVGINADNVKVGSDKSSVASRNYRKALATAMAFFREDSIEEYYGEMAHVIEYPISSVSWACPQVTDEGYRIAFSRDVDGNEIFSDGMTGGQRREAVKSAVLGYFKAAGFTVRNGRLSAAPEGASIGIRAIIPGGGYGDQPAFKMMTDASALLAEIGFDLEIYDAEYNNELWNALETGTAAIWGAAWGSTADPDMYQIYFSGNGTVPPGGSNYTYGIDDPELNDLILAARNTTDQNERKNIYKKCLDIIMDWAVEIPVYQRKNITVFSSERIDIDSVAKDLTPFYGWTGEIASMKLK